MARIGPLLALIFDCDGVLVDSETLSCGAWLPVLARRGIEATLADMAQFIGKADQAVLDYYCRIGGKRLTVEAIAELQDEYFSAARGNLSSFPTAIDVLREFRQRSFKLAVASSGGLDKIRFNLTEIGLDGFFDRVVSATEVLHGKPAPDLFCLAAERLEVSAADCAVVEDSVYGIEAARAAGMTAIGFTSSHDRATLRNAGAQHVVDDYVGLRRLVTEELSA
jgi:HAD superfamily hydrolase (TIGR01509 family)